MRIIVLSNHYYRSKRRSGFHFLADSLCKAGHEILFITTGLSWISYARGDYRTSYPGLREAHGRLIEERKGFLSYVHFTPWHPHTLILPQLDALTAPFMGLYAKMPLGPAEEMLRSADLFVYESCNALFLFEKCKAMAPGAKSLYRVSDDIRLLRSAHPSLFALESRIAPAFDLISVPCDYLAAKFSGVKRLAVHQHGVNAEAFASATKSPYSTPSNCVFVGNAYLDCAFLRAAAAACPDVQFHIIGPFKSVPDSPNIVRYGEIPFAETAAFVKFADVGLHTLDLSHSEHSLSFTDSLKVKQYRFCGLPVVAPGELGLSGEGVFSYGADPGSCAKAVREALASGKDLKRGAGVETWDLVASKIMASLFVEPASS